MKKHISLFGKENPERFNEDFIYMKRTDNVLDYIDDVCKALEVIDGVKFIGSEMSYDESEIKTRGKKNNKWISLDESRLNLIKLHFEVTGIFGRKREVKTEKVEKVLLYPKLIDDFYFLLDGVTYFPIYQIIDLATYNTATSLRLKTLLMPMVLREEDTMFEDTEGNEHSDTTYVVDLFKYKLNTLFYYFAEYGYDIGYLFGYSDKDIGLININDEELENKSHYKLFEINKKGLHVYVHEDMLEEGTFKKKFSLMYLDMINFNSRMTIDKISNNDYWKKRLGAVFTSNPNSQIEKSEKIILSFKRILDERTKKILRIKKEYKKDTFTIIQWMMRNFDKFMQKDNMDLSNKRIRLHEYLIYPLLTRFSSITYRLLNKTTPTFNQKMQLFSTLGPGYIVKKLKKNELLRYNNCVNGMDIINGGLKFTQSGPQSLSDGNKNVAVRYRGIHGSYVGRIGLTASSNSDPGISGTFTPFIKTDGLYFTGPDPDDNE